MTQSKISRSYKFHQYFQILINLWIFIEFFIDTTFLTFEMHNFALDNQFFKVLCLKSMKLIKIVLFSYFWCSDSQNAKNQLKYTSTALLCLYFRSYFRFIMNCDANIHIKTVCLLKMMVFLPKKMFFTKNFHWNHAH